MKNWEFLDGETGVEGIGNEGIDEGERMINYTM
jgi:hypothetical protein